MWMECPNCGKFGSSEVVETDEELIWECPSCGWRVSHARRGEG